MPSDVGHLPIYFMLWAHFAKKKIERNLMSHRTSREKFYEIWNSLKTFSYLDKFFFIRQDNLRFILNHFLRQDYPIQVNYLSSRFKRKKKLISSHPIRSCHKIFLKRFILSWDIGYRSRLGKKFSARRVPNLTCFTVISVLQISLRQDFFWRLRWKCKNPERSIFRYHILREKLINKRNNLCSI